MSYQETTCATSKRSAKTLQMMILHIRGPQTLRDAEINRAIQTHGVGELQGKKEQGEQ